MVLGNPVNIAELKKRSESSAGKSDLRKELTEEELLKRAQSDKCLNINYKFLEYENCRSSLSTKQPRLTPSTELSWEKSTRNGASGTMYPRLTISNLTEGLKRVH
jgi:hypothetical protein